MIETTGIKLDPAAQFKVTEATLRSILKSYELILQSYMVAPSGIENTTILIGTDKGKFALRIYRQNRKEKETIVPELDFMELLRSHEIPVPAIILNAQDRRITQYIEDKIVWHCILMEWMPGEHPKVYTSELLEHLAYIQAKMHRLGAGFLKDSYPQEFTSNILAAKGLLRHVDVSKITRPEIKKFLKNVERFQVALPENLPRGFNHLDYDHANILAQGDKVTAVLDFDDVAGSPVAICLGYTLWDILSVSGGAEKVREYLQYYSELRKPMQEELNVLKDVITFRNYIVGCIQLGFWGEDNENVLRCVALEKEIVKLEIKS